MPDWWYQQQGLTPPTGGTQTGTYPFGGPQQTVRIPSMQSWTAMTPAEKSAHQAVIEMMGIPWREYAEQTARQAPIRAAQPMGWR